MMISLKNSRKYTEQIISNQWKNPSWILLLLPFSLLYFCFSFFFRAKKDINSNVWIVGNAAVGGSGKTPVVLEIAKWLKNQNASVVILSRGYGGMVVEPCYVEANDDPNTVGDEALMLKKELNIPVMVASKRMLAVNKINQELRPDVILSDDGLQHRGLSYYKSIILAPKRKNKLLLPAGPMRTIESLLIKASDLCIHTLNSGISGFIAPDGSIVEHLPRKEITAFSGIARPERFVNNLTNMGYTVEHIAFPDHHQYSIEDFQSQDFVVVTPKDAVKIDKSWVKFYVANYFVELTPEIIQELTNWLNQMRHKSS